MALDLADQAGPVIVTLAYVGLYYTFQIRQTVVKNRVMREYAARGEKFHRYFGQDHHMLAADRTMLNTLEHMGPFLALLWLNAVFVSPLVAALGGAIYVAARVAYPFVMGPRLGRGIPLRIVAATGVGYTVLGVFTLALIVAMITGSSS